MCTKSIYEKTVRSHLRCYVGIGEDAKEILRSCMFKLCYRGANHQLYKMAYEIFGT